MPIYYCYLKITQYIYFKISKKKELESQAKKFQKEREDLNQRLSEKERELSYLRSNNYSDKKTKKLNPDHIAKDTKNHNEKKLTDQSIFGLEHKIDNIEKSINNLKLGLDQKDRKFNEKISNGNFHEKTEKNHDDEKEKVSFS